MNQINYDDKVYLNEEPDIADINKIKDTDMNEIKQVVNANAIIDNKVIEALGLNQDSYDSTKNYSQGAKVLHNYGLYKANQDITAEEWNEEHWELIPIIIPPEN